MFGQDPFSGAVFVFRSKRADRIKLLVWDRTGMVLVHKRLEGSRFVWPQVRDGVMRMSPAQLAALFEGLDWRLVRPEQARRPQAAGRSPRGAGSRCFCWSCRASRDSLQPMDADALARENALLKARLAEVEAILSEVKEANRRLEDIFRTAQREKFGKSSEKLSPDQFNLALEDAELAQGVLEAARGRRPRRRCGPPRARMRPAGLRATLAICRRICPGSSG